ncbi:MAG TPA: TIGR03560 family F420-dependent LLM class oxidoreductase [Candidatus Dormibacteraeota bacterium]|jgi:F420-dependent oxidoreductase-like protein|nr:TIGR03560 family F420-dependent LLM class oxidoreductase [Candidatus Dormibacteraeota bacterium]
MDHLYQIRGLGPETEPMLEAYTTLAAIAAQTSRIKVSAMVAGVTYRNPALLAKQVTTLDVISNGRALFGIGAAWNQDEHVGYGFDFPPIRERMDRLEEAVQIARLMFTEGRPSFQGKYYRIERVLNVPRPIQEGGPKIIIGGGGEKRTLRILAKHGDIGDWFGTGGIADLKRKREVFLRHCEDVGRDPSQVQILVGTFLVLVESEKEARAIVERVPAERRAMVSVATVPQAAELIGDYLGAGFAGIRFSNQVLPTDEAIARAGEVIKAVNGSTIAA